MGILSLQVANFKSYKGIFEIPFETTPFVAVVGPNGSGKSNMLDALCFVIGLQPNKLRGRNKSDLIAVGSNANDMFVAIRIMDEFGEEVELKRTASEYYVNGKAISEENYAKKWESLNILPGGKNAVIFQREIESLGVSGSKGLAQLVESLSESLNAPFDFDNYEALERELNTAAAEAHKLTQSGRAALAKADEHLKLDEAKSKLEDLRLQLRKSEKRKEGLIQREQIAVLNGIRKEIREANKHLNDAIEERNLSESDAKKLRKEFARKRRNLQNARMVESEAKSAVALTESHLEPINKKLEILESELRLLGPEVDFSEQTVQAAVDEIDNVRESIRLLQREFKRDKNKDSEAHDRQQDISPELRQMWTDLDTEFIAETALQQDEIRFLRRESEKLQQQLNIETRTQEDMQSELNSLNSKQKNYNQRVQQLSSLIKERTSQQDDRREELAKVASDLVAVTGEQRELKLKLKELSAKIKTADGNKQALIQRHKLLDAVERLRRAHPGVHDILGNLVEAVEPRFQNALDKGIGAFHLDTIIVEDVETAFACIDQAKKDRLGRLHFMALSNLRMRDLASARSMVSREVSKGFDVRLLVDCGKFDSRYRAAVVQVLGDAAYISSYEDSRKLRDSGLKMKLVTSNGSVISSSNIVSTSAASSLSSGSNTHRHLALMQRNEINLAEKLKLSQSKEIELSDSEVRLNGLLTRADLTIKAAQDELETALEQLESTEKSISNQQRVIDEVNRTVENTRNKRDQSEVNLETHLDGLAVLKKKKFAKFLKEAGGSIQSWDELFASGAQRLYELRRQGQRLNDRLQIATEKRNTAASQLAKQKERLTGLESSIEQVTAQKETLESELVANNTKLSQARSRLSIVRTEAEEKSDEVGMAESALDNAKLKVSEAERESKRHKVALASQKSANPNDENQDENSENDDDFEDEEMVELSDSDDMDVESDSNVSRRQKRKRNAKDVSKRDRQTLSIDRLETRITKIRNEIDVLARLVGMHGSDVDNDDEVEGASQKSVHASQVYDQLSKQASEARTKQDRVSKEFETLREERASRFMKVFHILQNALTSVFAELVGEDAQARLTVIDSEKPFDGVEFTIMPPGKPYTPVAQLSGGETSMATLALLFACQKLRPAPFIILDEVDAALDFANVTNLSNYVLAHCTEAQFIVVSLHQRLFQTASHLVGVYKPKKYTEIVTVPV